MNIPKENIEEIIGLMGRFFWLIYIPFALFLGVSAMDLAQKQKDIAVMEKVIADFSGEGIDNTIEAFGQYAFLTEERPLEVALHTSIKENLQQLGNLATASPTWIEDVEGIIEKRDQHIIDFEMKRGIFIDTTNMKRKLLSATNEHVGIRPLAVYLLVCGTMELAMNHLSLIRCAITCSYFDPVEQWHDGSRYIYPDNPGRHNPGSISLKVNGKQLEDNRFVFHPHKTGKHVLDVDYTFWGAAGVQTIHLVKSLEVE